MNDKPLPTVLFSNSLEQLLLRLKENVQAHPADPFYRIEIIVSDAHVKTVLQLELAKVTGILFGVEITTVVEMAQKASGASFLDLFIAASSIGVNPEAALGIANELAQEEWYGCTKDAEIGPKCAQARQKLGARKAKTKQPPNETHVFAVSALCPKLNDLLFLRPKVAYYVLSPCMHFWSDICSDQEAKKLTRRLHAKHAQALQGYLYDRSRLLANNATRARDFITYLEEKLEDFQEEYVLKEWVTKDSTYSQYIRDEVVCKVVAVPPTLLDIIQNDLLLMGASSDVQRTFTKDDMSVQIHKAPTIAREVEVLYQYIQQITPKVSGRIVVYAPDIEVYKPYIQSCFTHNTEVIAPKKKEVLAHFLQLLDMPYKRLQPKKIYELFQVEAFRKKCGIELEDVTLLAAALQKFEVTQGKFKDQVILSWISSFQQSFELTSSDAEVLGKCLATLESLYSDIQSLEAKKTRPCLEWQKLFLQILEKYFDSVHDEFYTIKPALIAVCQNEMLTILEEIDQEKALSIFKVALTEFEEQKSSPSIASIIFASLGELRTLPRDVVCFIGMHEGSFPRSNSQCLRKYGFLHTAKPPYTVSAIDRHLFLEAILATTSMLYISYQSYGFKERSFLQPSGIVLDILETLDCACTIDLDMPSKVLVKHHPLESCQEVLQIGVFDQAPSTPSPYLQIAQGLPIDVIYTHELSQVAKYPIRAYMQHGLGLYLREYNARVRSNEFEVLEPRSLSMTKKQAFVLPKDEASLLGNQEYRFLPQALKSAACSLLEDDIALLNKNAKALGIKADEPLQIELSRTCKTAQQRDVRSWKLPALTFDINGKQVTVAGTIANIYPEGIAVFEKKSSDALFKIWPELLLVHALAGHIPIQPNVLYLKDAKVEMVELENATHRLKEYIAYALECRKMPSCIYPDWVDALQTADAPPEKITERSSYAARDPYLELYLSRVSPEDFQVEWSRWRNQALQLFKKTS